MQILNSCQSRPARVAPLWLGMWLVVVSLGASGWAQAASAPAGPPVPTGSVSPAVPAAPAGPAPGSSDQKSAGAKKVDPKVKKPDSNADEDTQGSLDTLASQLQKLLNTEIDDNRISVDTVVGPGDQILVILSGSVDTNQEKEGVCRVARHVAAKVKALVKKKDAAAKLQIEVLDHVRVKSPDLHSGVAGEEEEEVTRLFTLTYVHSKVGSTAETSPPDSTSNTAPASSDVLVDALNTIFESPGAPIVQGAGRGRLLLHGPRQKVFQIERFLTLIDVPWPQVQVNMWAIQVSGSAEGVASRVRTIGREVRRARDQMAEVQRKLAQIVSDCGDCQQEGHLKKLQGNLAQFGIDLPSDGFLSLNESLMFLALDPWRDQRVRELQDFVKKRYAPGPESERQRPRCVPAECRPLRQAPFDHLANLFALESYGGDLESFMRFAKAARHFRDGDEEGAVLDPDAPHDLLRAGIALDRALKAVMEAYAADMDELFLDPLLDHIQELGVGGRRTDGIALVGRTHIVVTSGLEAGLAPKMASFVESGRPKPFGTELLNLAFPASKSGETTKKDVLTGASKILAGLSEAQALALAAVLTADTEPAFTSVAPGIAINVRPTVLPDAGAARLTVDARFGVTSTPLNTDRPDIWRQAPPAGIASHEVRTDTAVSAFDLFDISSFSVTASHPRSPFYIPILGRLPVIGQAFQIPRHDQETLFESLILVNTVIVPRSIELYHFYGRERLVSDKNDGH